MSFYNNVRLVATLALVFTLACDAVAFAQRSDRLPERSQAGSLSDGAALHIENARLVEPLWTLAAPQSLARTNDPDAFISGAGAAYFGDRYGAGDPVIAVDERTGATRWKTTIIGAPFGYAAGVLFCLPALRQFEEAHVIALDAQNGRMRWSTPGEWLAIERQLAIVVHGSHLEARDAASGTLRWSAVWGRATPHEARLVGTTLLLRTIESGAILTGFLYAFDIRDGRALFTVRSANAILGTLRSGEIVVDTTWGPAAYVGYEPLTTSIVSLTTGAERVTHTYAPDRERWAPSSDPDAHTARNVFADDESLAFRVGADTVYDYPLTGDPAVVAATRYNLKKLSPIETGTWLAQLPDGTAAVARLTSGHAQLRPITGLDAIDFTTTDRGLVFIAGRDLVAVFDPARPADATVTHFACSTIERAFVADGAFIAVCSAPSPRLVALRLPGSEIPIPLTTPIPMRPQPTRSFNLTPHVSTIPTQNVRLRGAAFGADGTPWFCENAVMPNGIAGHTDFIGHLRANGVIDEFPVPTLGANVSAIARGPNGAMLFLEASAIQLGRITADGTISEKTLPPELGRGPSFPGQRRSPPLTLPNFIALPQGRKRHFEALAGLVVGSDNAVWITAPYANSIARVTTDGSVHVFQLPGAMEAPGAITRGPDGALWFLARESIGRITADGKTTAYPMPMRGLLTSIVWGPDANIWFSNFDGRVGRITAGGTGDAKSSKRGKLTMFPAPVVAAPSGPLIGGCDGALYIADRFRPALWRVTLTGEFVQHDMPYAIQNLARSADCSFGFTEAQAPVTTHVGTISLGLR